MIVPIGASGSSPGSESGAAGRSFSQLASLRFHGEESAPDGRPTLFVVGTDYHLGDLLWLTVVLRQYRRKRRPSSVAAALPDRDISRILEQNPLLDRIIYYRGGVLAEKEVATMAGQRLVVHDLRVLPVAIRMLRDWRHHLPWLYYRDLWVQPRGQWLATYLHLGSLTEWRPVLGLVEPDRPSGQELDQPYAVLGPHIGSYTLPLAQRMWRRIKGWDNDKWAELAARLREAGLAVYTLGSRGQEAVPGTMPLLGLPIRQVAWLIKRASALICGESGLWFVAAATKTPFVIVPWWLPSSIDWPARMGVPYALVRRQDATVEMVMAQLGSLLKGDATVRPTGVPQAVNLLFGSGRSPAP